MAVMMPDLPAYAPFIKAVFDAPEDSRLRIPYSLADMNLNAESPVVKSFFCCSPSRFHGSRPVRSRRFSKSLR